MSASNQAALAERFSPGTCRDGTTFPNRFCLCLTQGLDHLKCGVPWSCSLLCYILSWKLRCGKGAGRCLEGVATHGSNPFKARKLGSLLSMMFVTSLPFRVQTAPREWAGLSPASCHQQNFNWVQAAGFFLEKMHEAECSLTQKVLDKSCGSEDVLTCKLNTFTLCCCSRASLKHLHNEDF